MDYRHTAYCLDGRGLGKYFKSALTLREYLSLTCLKINLFNSTVKPSFSVWRPDIHWDDDDHVL